MGGDLVCDAIIAYGSDEQKERCVKSLFAGEICAAASLAEPRGG